MKRLIAVAVTAGVAGLVGGALSQTNLPIWQQTTNNNWLSEAPNDAARWARLQFVLRGTDVPMIEIGQRYQAIYDALGDANYDLALYHWEKIREGVRGAALKRPARRPNAQAMFLESIYDEVRQTFATRNAAQAWSGFELGRGACMSCHGAENLAWINDQPLFRNTEQRPRR